MKLPAELYVHLSYLPRFTLSENQWLEAGWMYDPLGDRYLRYADDRKDGSWTYDKIRTPDEFRDKVLPKSKAALRRWAASFDVRADDGEIWIHHLDDNVVVRFSARRTRNDPKPERLPTAEAADEAPAAVAEWLRAGARDR